MDFTYAAILTVFVLTYGLITVRKVGKHRTKAYVTSLIDVALMIDLGILPFNEISDSIEWSVIFLLFGMMALNGALEYCGFYDIVVEKLMRPVQLPREVHHDRHRAYGDTVRHCPERRHGFIFCPIIKCCRKLRANPIPFLVAVFIAANIGLAATFVSAPHNAVVETHARITFIAYSVGSVPLVLIYIPLIILIVK